MTSSHPEPRSAILNPPAAGEVQAALDAGLLLAEPELLEPGRIYSVTTPAGATHELTRAPAPSPEHDADPGRARGSYHPATVEALIAVITRHHDEQATTVWVHPTAGRVTTVFNDAAPGAPAWRDHRAVLQLTKTPEWEHWAKRDGHLGSQTDFAEHVEDGLAEIVEPAAAEMLELAQTFHAHQAASFRQATRLQDGRIQVRYDETIDAKAGDSGQMDIPSTFTLAIAPFLGEAPYKVTARLRYRSSGGNLQIGYKLDRPDRVIRDALEQISQRLEAEFPNVYVGEPAA